MIVWEGLFYYRLMGMGFDNYAFLVSGIDPIRLVAFLSLGFGIAA